MRYLLPAMLNTARPSLRILALPMARFTSAGVAQSAALTCRYQAINGSRASACAGASANESLERTERNDPHRITYHSPILGPRGIFCALVVFQTRNPAPRRIRLFPRFFFCGLSRAAAWITAVVKELDAGDFTPDERRGHSLGSWRFLPPGDFVSEATVDPMKGSAQAYREAFHPSDAW